MYHKARQITSIAAAVKVVPSAPQSVSCARSSTRVTRSHAACARRPRRTRGAFAVRRSLCSGRPPRLPLRRQHLPSLFHSLRHYYPHAHSPLSPSLSLPPSQPTPPNRSFRPQGSLASPPPRPLILGGSRAATTALRRAAQASTFSFLSLFSYFFTAELRSRGKTPEHSLSTRAALARATAAFIFATTPQRGFPRGLTSAVRPSAAGLAPRRRRRARPQLSFPIPSQHLN